MAAWNNLHDRYYGYAHGHAAAQQEHVGKRRKPAHTHRCSKCSLSRAHWRATSCTARVCTCAHACPLLASSAIGYGARRHLCAERSAAQSRARMHNHGHARAHGLRIPSSHTAGRAPTPNAMPFNTHGPLPAATAQARRAPLPCSGARRPRRATCAQTHTTGRVVKHELEGGCGEGAAQRPRAPAASGCGVPLESRAKKTAARARASPPSGAGCRRRSSSAA